MARDDEAAAPAPAPAAHEETPETSQLAEGEAAGAKASVQYLCDLGFYSV